MRKGLSSKVNPIFYPQRPPSSVLILPLHIEEWLKRPEVEYAKSVVVESKGIHFELELLKMGRYESPKYDPNRRLY